MLLFPAEPTPTDDRGNPLDLSRARAARELNTPSDGVSPEARRAQVMWDRTDHTRKHDVLGSFLWWLLPAALYLVLIRTIFMTLQSVWRWLLFVVIFLLFGFLHYLYKTALMPRRTLAAQINAFAYYGCCPQCLSSLRGLGPHADGCLLCPECGAAWRADRLGPASLSTINASPGQTPATAQASRPDTSHGSHVVVMDARGVPVSLASPDLSELSPAERETIPAEERKNLLATSTLPPDKLLWRWVWIGFLLLAFGVPLITSYPILLWILPPAVVLLWFLLRTPRSERGKFVADPFFFVRGMLRLGRCPSCAGSMENVAPDAEIRWHCPHCKAAWRQRGEGSTG